MLEVPILAITNGKKTIVSVEDFTIKSGDFVYLRSDLPCGKTLFLKALYYFLGQSEKKRNKYIDKRMVFTWDVRQHKKLYLKAGKDVLLMEFTPALFPLKTVQKNILLPLRNVNIRTKDKIIDYLQLLNIEDKQYVTAQCLSVSEKKLIELIRAVILLPKVLLIDDFDLSFHLPQQPKVFELLKLMQENGTVIIASGKKKNDAIHYCCTIEDNQVVEV
jgi:ABC-type lipoprotein export system ATPase subunit